MKLTIGGRISSIKIVFGIQTLSSAVPFGSDLKQLSHDVFLRQKNAAPTNTPVAATPASTIPVMVPLPIPLQAVATPSNLEPASLLTQRVSTQARESPREASVWVMALASLSAQGSTLRQAETVVFWLVSQKGK